MTRDEAAGAPQERESYAMPPFFAHANVRAALMRLWTVHPRYLDARGLVALWREGLLARAVLRGRTIGYRHHPQLARFREHRDPWAAIDAYLWHVVDEAQRRGYHFDARKLGTRPARLRMRETRGQLLVEWRHLRRKLRARAPAAYRLARGVSDPDAHPLFRIVPGHARDWERARDR